MYVNDLNVYCRKLISKQIATAWREIYRYRNQMYDFVNVQWKVLEYCHSNVKICQQSKEFCLDLMIEGTAIFILLIMQIVMMIMIWHANLFFSIDGLT